MAVGTPDAGEIHFAVRGSRRVGPGLVLAAPFAGRLAEIVATMKARGDENSQTAVSWPATPYPPTRPRTRCVPSAKVGLTVALAIFRATWHDDACCTVI